MKTLFARVRAWFTLRRVCAWHPGGPRYMGGWPWARQTSHGACRRCYRRVMAEIDAKAGMEERR